MTKFNDHIDFVDYGDVVNHLTMNTSISAEDAFYFYEHCTEIGLFRGCRTSEKVCELCLKELMNEELATVLKAKNYIAAGDKAVNRSVRGNTIQDKTDSLARVFNAGFKAPEGDKL